ncbi:MAG: GNAT family N-acetyltransferase, partial [Exiguobacterium profundum]
MITLGRGSVNDYVAHLEACDDLFPTRLSERVDLRAYAEKLHDRATSFELWQDDRLVGMLSAYMDTDVAFISHI